VNARTASMGPDTSPPSHSTDTGPLPGDRHQRNEEDPFELHMLSLIEYGQCAHDGASDSK
jgi:hypothetical protein